MADESGTPNQPVRRRRRPKPAVTNINIFALGAPGSGEAAPARQEPESEPVQEDTLVSSQWLERRSKRLDKYEQELRQRALEIEVREAELEQREAEFEAEAFIRSEALEERERRILDLEKKIGHRETELSSYVARVQGGMLRADAL